jgi:hypothetical protein
MLGGPRVIRRNQHTCWPLTISSRSFKGSLGVIFDNPSSLVIQLCYMVKLGLGKSTMVELGHATQDVQAA